MYGATTTSMLYVVPMSVPAVGIITTFFLARGGYNGRIFHQSVAVSFILFDSYSVLGILSTFFCSQTHTHTHTHTLSLFLSLSLSIYLSIYLSLPLSEQQMKRKCRYQATSSSKRHERWRSSDAREGYQKWVVLMPRSGQQVTHLVTYHSSAGNSQQHTSCFPGLQSVSMQVTYEKKELTYIFLCFSLQSHS